ncbi:uncharacterized protein LOC127870403 isoform X1 [Dreissena polymorpha]|uniref:uncharacterized protein LOC127870403 isoform X1 n=1 Tax=Dreissena polymorpha TaxID=45954 RepID=UPI002264C0CD|nr:uncharacterized protein LOC127870403 isoform X1 [Dreissena polymorpha]
MASRQTVMYSRFFIPSDKSEKHYMDECSQLMAGTDGIPRLLSVEEKWQIIFNEKTRAPIYALTHYLQYLNQFVSGHTDTSRDGNDVIKKDGISPLSYLLRKLKLDLKMSYDSFIEEFLKPKNNGMNLLVKLLKSIQNTGSRQFGSASMTQLKNYKKTLTDEHDCLLCIKYSLRLKGALSTLLDDRYGLEAVCTSLVSTFTKSRGTAVEILTIAMAATDGFARVLDCFTYLQLKIGEPVRFKSLVNMMNMDSPQNIIFKVSSMKFVNTLLDASSNTNVRVFLQHELEQAGLDVTFMAEKLTGNGLEYDDLHHELANWQRKYVNVDHVMQKRATVLQTQEEMHNSQKLIADLQHQVQKLCTEKENLARTLKLVSIELKQKHADLRRRYDDGCDAFTQCSSRDVQDVALQCDLRARTVDKDTPLRTAAEYFRWNTTITGEKTNGAIFYPPTRKPEGDNADDDRDENQPEVVDEEGAVKVSQWLKTHCSSSTKSDDRFCDCDAEGASNDASSAFGFKRNSLTRRRARKTEFPGNWKLIPKSIERFPSRFPTQCCHVTKCDRCDIRDGPDNSGQRKPNLNKAEQVHFGVRLISNKDSSKRLETHSQSSDSAIGGSGDRLWNERRLPVLPVAASDEDVLQDLVQPDDSASGCTTINEPLPDYSFRTGSQADHNSFIAELSSVLREFEGHLLMYETPVSGLKNNSGHKSTPIETYVSLGNI